MFRKRLALVAFALVLTVGFFPSLAQALPDLRVTRIEIGPLNPQPGQPVEMRALVYNGGDDVLIYTRNRVTRNGYFLFDLDVGPMYRNASQWTSWRTVGVLGSGQHTFRVCADALNQVAEANESNNCLDRVITIPNGQPNLVVTDLEWQPSRPEPGEAVQVRAVVWNSGYGTVPTTTSRLWIDNVQRADVTTPSIGPGGYTFTPWVQLGSFSAGNKVVRLCADALGQVAESNESDNCRSETMTVQWGADLVVTAIEWNPPNPSVGQPVQMRARVTNQGWRSAGPSTARFWMDNMQRCDAGVAGLAAGAYTWTGWCAIGSLSPATHMGQVCADITNMVPEGYEGNNCRTGSIYVSGGAADLIVAAIEWSPPNPAPGSLVQMRALIRNQGTADAGGSTVRFRVDGIVKADLSIGGLWAGTEMWAGFANVGTYTAGSHTVQVCADALGQISEGDETNNCRSDVMRIATTLFSEGFEAGTVPGAVWSATDGNTSSGADYWGDMSASAGARAHSGLRSVYCAANSDVAGQIYDHNMLADLTKSAPINVSGYTSVEISFWIWFVGDMPEGGYDRLSFQEMSGGVWVERESWVDPPASWRLCTYSVPAQSTYQFRFVFSSNGQYAYEGAYIDDILITGFPPAAPPQEGDPEQESLASRASAPAADPESQSDRSDNGGTESLFLPVRLELSNTPNPFAGRTLLRFGLPSAARTRLEIYGVAGRLVQTLLNGEFSAGRHEVAWDGKDETGRSVSSGVYLARISLPGEKAVVHRMILTR